MPATLRSVLFLALLALGTSVLPASALAARTARPAEDGAAETPGRLVLVLDSSGSMAERASGGRKIDAAKEALGQVVEQLPDDAQVGIRVFGAKVFSREEPGACRDTQNVVPVGALDRDALSQAVADYEPYGETPIGAALQGAAADLGPKQAGVPRTIVLLSDGEPTCAPDPCKVARDLGKQGVDVKINVVGLDVSGKARRALTCIAEAGNGEYYDASSAEELANSMVKVSVRDLRGFRLIGERVEGGTASDTALPIDPGTYIDTSLPDEGKRYYVVEKPPGGGVALSALARPPAGEESWNTVLRVELLTPDGASCGENFDQALQILGLTPISSTGVAYNQFGSSLFAEEECAAAEELLATVSSKAGVSDYRLQISTYPAVENADALPPAIEEQTGPWVGNVAIPSTGPREPVVGGVTFDDAPELTPGTTYADTLRPSEQLVYKVRAGYGQSVRLSARLGTDPQAASVLGVQGPNVALHAFNALGDRQPSVFDAGKNVDGNTFYNGTEPDLVTAAVLPVRLRNIESPNDSIASTIHDGYQYFVLGMGRSVSAESRQFAAPVTLRAEVLGEVAGVPEYAGEVEGADVNEQDGAQDDAAEAQDADGAESRPPGSGDGTPWLLWALGGLGVLALAGLSYWLGRRRTG